MLSCQVQSSRSATAGLRLHLSWSSKTRIRVVKTDSLLTSGGVEVRRSVILAVESLSMPFVCSDLDLANRTNL